jgi:pimeloyl-ACP methyl ester carboxylesterase
LAIEARRDVVLVHGLWTPGAVLWLLAARLIRRGYRPRCFGYRGRDSFSRNVERLADYARALGCPAHFVGHSLGGVLAFETLNANHDIPLGATVLVAAPVCGCASARRLAAWRLGRWMLGRSDAVLCRTAAARWMRREPLGVIAGTRSIGAGRLLGALPGGNDGVVTEPETRVDGCSGNARLRHGHTSILFSRELAERVDAFLRDGRFSP